ncbi:hypothetical protein BDV95DRAFT_485268 [Massariosphaeria phaeospora]|uniref:Mediator complex subunit 15 KIX domain-containing protein n=1 Tax=Massariosphaeria phaeospora TaxID=100035 RepID=A0A7C8IJ70_9PLEO|nr:hypothetical protein BDV95DRAFT_485268 [Massariosphaeria phaeospora]
MNNPNMPNMMGGLRVGAQQNFILYYRKQQQQQQQQKTLQGWQQSVPPELRAQLAHEISSCWRLMKPEMNEMQTMQAAVRFETTTFSSSQTKDQYVSTIKQKLTEMQVLRQRAMAGMTNGLNNPQNAMNPGQMGVMGQSGLQPQRQNTPQQFQSGFPNPQLQRPMQPSPIPMSQSGSNMGVNGAETANPQQNQGNPQVTMQQGQQQRPRFDDFTVTFVMQRLMDQMSLEAKKRFQQDAAALPPDKLQQFKAMGIDPTVFRIRQQAEVMLRSGQVPVGMLQQAAQAANQNRGAMQQGGQQNQMQNQQMNANRQSNQEFDFNALANQQIEALRVQDQGQTVVPASNNPNASQMGSFPGQNAQAGQAQNAALAAQRAHVANLQSINLQRQHAQVQAQARARADQQQQQQAAQARNAGQMLQGQMGGLNLPPGTAQSPAMPMLTRPLAAPGQPGPTTPQQRPQAHIPQMTPQGQGQPQIDPQVATQLMREAQQRAAAAAQGQPLTEQTRMALIPADIDPTIKQHLLKLPDAQFRMTLANYASRRNNVPQNGVLSGGQSASGQPNMMMNSAQALQLGMQNPMMNGNMGNIGRGPGMNNGQQTPNGMGVQQLPMGQHPAMQQQQQQQHQQQQRLAIAQQLLSQNPGIIANTDGKPYPPTVLSVQTRQHVPENVKTWDQLKQWAIRNPNLMSGMAPQRLLLLQVLHFQDMMRQEHNKQNGMAGVRFQPPINGGVVAPPAQMTPGQVSARTPQQQAGMPPLAHMQVTPQELQVFRQRLQPNHAGTTDDQLRQYIMDQKTMRRQQIIDLQAAQQRDQGQPAAPTAMALQQPQVSRPQPTQAQPVQPTPQPKPANKQTQSQQSAQPNAQNNLNRGVKRPHEDAAEPPTEPPTASVAPQAPVMVPSRSQQGVHNLTQEQISKLTPAQQQQMRSQLLKAQDASNNKAPPLPFPPQEELSKRLKDPAREQRYRLMVAEEEQNVPRGQTVQLSPETRAQLELFVKERMINIRKIEYALRIFLAGYDGTDSGSIIRTVIKARVALFRQINHQDGSLNADLSMSPEGFRENIGRILSFVGKIMSRMAADRQQGQSAPAQPNSQQPQPPQSRPQALSARGAQLNAENLRINEMEQTRLKAPQAPTTDRPPFPLGGQSPQGTPAYFEGATAVKELRLPEKKRPRVDSNAHTPTSLPKASPRMGTGKGSSPELKRQPAPMKVEERKPTFRCKNAECEFHGRGFDTQAELETHVSQAHARIDDPMQFALQAMAEYADVDVKTGHAKKGPAVANRGAKPAAAVSRPQPTKAGQTPSLSQNAGTPAGPQAAATPMARVSTQTGIKGSPSASLLKTPQTGAKVATPSTGALAKATPSSVAKPSAKEPEMAVLPGLETEDTLQPLIPTSLLDFTYEEVYSALDANGPFTVLDLKDEDNSWALRSRPSSPIATPDSTSKDTPSTRQSDICENDNLQISLSMKEAAVPLDIPAAWVSAQSGDYPFDANLSDDLTTLGATLPPMDSDELMLFYPDSMTMDFDTLDKTFESMGGSGNSTTWYG